MRALGHNPTMKEVRKIINEVDTDGSCTVDFVEFVSMMEQIPVINLELEREKLVYSFRYHQNNLFYLVLPWDYSIPDRN